MTSDPERDRRRVRPPPSAVLEALKHGTKPAPAPRLITSSESAAPSKPIEDERSTPIEIADPSLSSTVARIEYRQLTDATNQLEIARVLGDVRIEQAEQAATLGGMATSLQGLFELAKKDDLRKDEAERRRVDREDKREDANAELAKSRASSRQTIVLAIIGAVVSVATAFGIGRALAPTTPSSSVPAAVSR